MSYYNNFFETEEQKRKRVLENNSNTTPFNPSTTQTPIKPLEQMSTREVLEYAWDKSEKENEESLNFIPYYERNKKQLCSDDFEGNTSYPYLDSAQNPNVTIGCGINIDSTPDIQLQNRHTGIDLSKEEQHKQLNLLKSSYRPNHRASYYENKSDIGISDTEHERIIKEKYADAFKNVKNEYPKFNSYNPSQQDALLDMNYNLGSTEFNKYKLMKKAIIDDNWEEAAKQSYRYGVSDYRNNWTAQSLNPNWKKYYR